MTRPEGAAGDTARRLSALGWRPVLAPMLRVVPVAACFPDPASIQALLVTSATTLAFLPASLRQVLLLAVGDATAARARAAGFARVESAGADAAALAALAVERTDPAGALLLAGAAGQAAALAARLEAEGRRVLHRAVYDLEPVAELPEAARLALANGEVAAGLFFSPATARTFVTALFHTSAPEKLVDVVALAISNEAAAPLAPLPWRRIRVATRPNQEELLALLP